MTWPHKTWTERRPRERSRLWAGLLVLLYPSVLAAAEPADPNDKRFDVSTFLDKPYGFVPMLSPITEPAVGYGATLALMFVEKVPSAPGQPPIRPNIGAVGGLGTQNGTRGAFAGHTGTWLNGRLRTLVGVADGDINLEYFGLTSGSRPGENGIDYNVQAKGGLLGVGIKLGKSDWWADLRYLRGSVDASLRNDAQNVPGQLPEADYDLNLAALTPRLTFDSRDNFFTPTLGAYIDLAVPLYRDAWGSERDFTKAALTGLWYHPLERSLFFGVRGSANYSSDRTPFYLRPGINLRGVEAVKYQGKEIAETEVELRWQFDRRFSLVGFAGAGTARSDEFGQTRSKTVYAGGGGFRYMIARRYGLHMGLDVGFGPDDPILYVVFGSAWLRE